MNNDPVYQRLREIAWRRELNATEQAELRAWLVAHPEAAAEHQLEAALSAALARLPDAPVPSNFTARVQQAIELEERAGRGRRRQWFWRVLLPRTAVAMLVVGASGLGYQQYRLHQRTGISTSLRTVAGVPTLPTPEILVDFDVIQRLDAEPAADAELIALLQ